MLHARSCPFRNWIKADSYWSLTQRAALLFREGKHREALPIWEQAVEASARPEHGVVTWVWLSRVQLGLGNHDAARMWLGKATSYRDQSVAKPKTIHLHNWREAQILRREVEDLLHPLNRPRPAGKFVDWHSHWRAILQSFSHR